MLYSERLENDTGSAIKVSHCECPACIVTITVSVPLFLSYRLAKKYGADNG
jgi:hypothetical protein